ncbi:hypothetical protein PIB30_103999 [Stylosanthes scabra]|uniref:Uncharacterized protein n=1 Tax=Stylosanthes scabra TaxID=79078 RepID=A0ABU6YX44_9FABA|nr:hypothetical protein [Stylosanthes scabra]
MGTSRHTICDYPLPPITHANPTAIFISPVPRLYHAALASHSPRLCRPLPKRHWLWLSVSPFPQHHSIYAKSTVGFSPGPKRKQGLSLMVWIDKLPFHVAAMRIYPAESLATTPTPIVPSSITDASTLILIRWIGRGFHLSSLVEPAGVGFNSFSFTRL